MRSLIDILQDNYNNGTLADNTAIGEQFTLTFDMSRIFIEGQGLLSPDATATLSLNSSGTDATNAISQGMQAAMLNGLTSVEAYSVVILGGLAVQYDWVSLNLQPPTDITSCTLPYTDGATNYTFHLSDTVWSVKYNSNNSSHSILEGTLLNNKLSSTVHVDNYMIEFPVLNFMNVSPNRIGYKTDIIQDINLNFTIKKDIVHVINSENITFTHKISIYGQIETNLIDIIKVKLNSSDSLLIEGINEENIWNDFIFSYSLHGEITNLHIENISLETSTVDNYCIYSRNTITTINNVVIDGYSGRSGETGGGALRIRAANYENLSGSGPHLTHVISKNGCRGFRIQDCTGCIIKDCTSINNTDNAFYLASGTYKSTAGCINCSVLNCSAITTGQCAYHSIGGSNNIFKDCTMDTSDGAALMVYNTNGTITFENITCKNANTEKTQTPWQIATNSSSTVDGNNAALAFSVESTDTSGKVIVKNCTFVSGSGSVFYKQNETGELLINEGNAWDPAGGFISLISHNSHDSVNASNMTHKYFTLDTKIQSKITEIQKAHILTEGESSGTFSQNIVSDAYSIKLFIREKITIYFPYINQDTIYFNVWPENKINKVRRLLHISIRYSEGKVYLNHMTKKETWANPMIGNLNINTSGIPTTNASGQLSFSLQLVNLNSMFSNIPTHLIITSDLFDVPNEFRHPLHPDQWLYPLFHESNNSAFTIENISSNINEIDNSVSFSYEVLI